MAYIGKKPSDTFRATASIDTFTGDGSTTTFDLTDGAIGANDIQVFVNNVRQEPGSSKSYTLGVDGNGVNKRITFNVAPEASDAIYVINPDTKLEAIRNATNIDVAAFTSATEDTSPADGDFVLVQDVSAGSVKKVTKTNFAPTVTLSYTTRNYTGDGADTTFTVTDGTTVDSVIVTENGVVQRPTTDYTISGTVLTFTTAPADQVAIQIRELPVSSS